MHPSHAQLALLASFIGLSLAATSSKNCSDNKDGATLSCYTCMGRDQENCEYGQVCCKGSCYKLVDEDHQLIVKGCTNDNEEDASMKRRTLDVALYWTNQEKVTGESYFCSGKNFCNSGTAVSVLSSVAALLILTLLR